MPADDSDAQGSSLWNGLVDLLVYAPIGLTLDAQDLAPDLARRGRQHTAAARRIGEFAVKAGMARLDDLVATFDSPPTDDASASVGPEPILGAPAEASTDASTASVALTAHDDQGVGDDEPTGGSAELAIPDYDLLAASQVVKRLDALDSDQLDAIRRHEEAGRGRRTILHKITRLQAG